MNEIALKRIKDLKEKIAAAVNNNLGGNFSESTKARLALLLAETGLTQVEGTIFSYLQNHPDQEEAIIAAARFENEEMEHFLLELLKNFRSAHREVIAEKLGEKKKAAMVAHLKPFLADSNRHVRFQAAYSLFNIGGKDAALALCDYISDPDEWISMTILRLLCIMRELDSIPILIEKYHQDEDLRRKALMISFLSRFKSVTLLGIFDEGIQARDARLRANSIEAVGTLNLPEAEIKGRIEPFLRDPNNRIRANCILALARLEPEKIKPEIQEMVYSNDVQLRRSAAFILGMIPPNEYQDLASVLIVDQNEAVRKRMIQSLRNFPADFVVSQLDRALSDANKWIRKHAIDMAARIPGFPHQKVLALLKTERAAPNLEACLNFFASHPIEEAMNAIKLHLKDRRLQVVRAMLAAVSAIGGVEGVKSIAPRLEQRDPKVIEALSEILVKAGERKLLEDLVDRFSQVRNEQQVLALIPSLTTSIKILEQGDKMPEPLLRSFEKIDVEEKPVVQPAPVVAPPDNIDETSSVSSGDSQSDGGSFTQSESGLDLSSDLPDLASLGAGDMAGDDEEDEPAAKKEKGSPHYKAGLKAYNLGKYKKAIAEFSRLLAEEADPPANVRLYMGIMLNDAEKYEDAAQHLEKFLALSPDNSKANYLLGKVYKQLKNWNGLVKIYSRFTDGEVDISPKLKKRVYHELGVACVLTGKYERGAQLLESLLKIDPENPEVGYYLALAQFNLGKLSNAAATLHKAGQKADGTKRIGKLIAALAQKVKSGIS